MMIRRTGRSLCTRMALLVALGAWLAPCARAELPGTFAEGKLLASATLEGPVEVGVYGPEPASRDEPSTLTVVLEGSEEVTVASGLVLMAAPRTAILLTGAPNPSAAYISYGQWSPDFEAEARQLLALNLDALWATRLIAMAPLELAEGPGALLDAVVFDATWAEPPAGPPFRDADAAQLGIAFVADDSIRHASEIPDATHGAHRVIFTVPLTFQDTSTTLSFWVACRINGKPVTGRLQVALTSRGARRVAERAEETLQLLAPEDGTEISESVEVAGTTPGPGMLVVAWIDGSSDAEEQPPAPENVVRHIVGDDANFTFSVPVPEAPASGDYVLHVRTEAPGYQSPQILRKLIRRPNL